MLPSVVLCLIVLTTVSSGPVNHKVVKTVTLQGRDFFWFGPTVRETFSEAERLCSLYGGEIAEPVHGTRHSLQEMFAPSYWLNGYYDVDSAMWRWVSDHFPIYYLSGSWDTDQPACKGDDCAHWRLIVVKSKYLKFATVDERLGTKLPVICEKL
ncbi:hypothetical protein HDE_13621 [Halotydeus destructor]|nr:hypothetical protein HDE_13621 [Halotydeus destructor]